jgi:hypothetical protein
MDKLGFDNALLNIKGGTNGSVSISKNPIYFL